MSEMSSAAVAEGAGAAEPRERPTLLQLARTWTAIGTQSLGGGPSTLYMIRSLMVERTRWVDPTTFRETWSIGQASPGIHLVALAGLLGHHLCGVRGIAVAVAAMIIPSSIITALFTAGLEEIQRFPLVQGMLRGIIPATGGMTLALAIFFGRSAARKGRIGLVDWGIIVVAGVLVGVAKAPVVLILLAAAVAGAFLAYAPSGAAVDDGR